MHELTKEFRFDAAHTLRREIAAEGSRRIHGHSYRAEVTLRGRADPATGMVMDAGLLELELLKVREDLDHHFLDEVEGIGGPATLENLSTFIWRRLEAAVPKLFRVSVWRDSSGDRASYYGEGG